MSAKSPYKAHLQIIDYLDIIDPEFAQDIRHCCANISLQPGRGKPGVTLLYPTEKSYREKIHKLAVSKDPADVGKACQMVNAMILREKLKTPDDWDSMKDDIPNSLFPSQQITVTKTSASKITLLGGSVIVEPDSGFIDASTRSNLAVWRIISGEIPINGPKSSKAGSPGGKSGAPRRRGPTLREPGSREGGYEVSQEAAAANLRFSIGLAAENAYLAFAGKKNVFCQYAMSLARYIESNDSAVFYDCVLPSISFRCMDFYILVEPHNFNGPYLVPTRIIRDWWEQFNYAIESMENILQYRDWINSKLIAAPAGSAAIYSADKRIHLISEIDSLRMETSDKSSSNPRCSVAHIREAYQKVETQNIIGDVMNVFPAGTAAYFKAAPGLKLMHDELRYLTELMFIRLESAPAFDRAQFQTIVEYIGAYMNARGVDEREHAAILCNRNLATRIEPTEKFREISTFVNSTLFLSIPLTDRDMEQYPVESSAVRPREGEELVYNVDKALKLRHVRLYGTQTLEGNRAQVQLLMNLLDRIDPSKLPPEAMARLKAKAV